MSEIQVTTDNRYRCAELVWVMLDGETRLAYGKDTGVWQAMPHQQAEALARCNVFDTLENHARARCRDFGLGENAIETIRGRLAELAEAGLMIGYQEMRKRCLPTAPGEAGKTRIDHVGFVTRDRLPLLERGLTSLLENTQRYDRRPSFWVMDDTENPDTRQSCRAALRALAQRYDVVIGYADSDAKKEFAARLAKESGVALDVVEFALHGPPSEMHRGANHNSLLLQTAGEVFFRMDDDVVAQVGAPPDPQTGLRFCTEQEPAEYWFFNDRDTALQSVSFVDKDLLGLHEQFLGNHLGDCIAAVPAGEEVGLNRMTAAWARRSASRGGRVLVTMNGLVGDCAISWPRWHMLGEPTRGRLVRSEAAYRAAFASREIVRSTRIAALSAGAFCMTYAVGLDNRGILPPVFPIGYGYDGLFAQMIQMSSADGLFGHLPWVVVHAPGEPRAFPAQAHAQVPIRDLTYVISVCASRCLLGTGERTDAERLIAMGRQLAGWAAQPVAEFEEWLRLLLWALAQKELRSFEAMLRSAGQAPAYWADDIRSHNRLLIEGMRQREFVVAQELRGGRSTEEAVALTREWLGRFGELLQAWPALWDAARRLRTNGHGLAGRP